MFGRSRGNGVLVCIHNIDGGADFPQRVGNDIAGDGGAGQQYVLALDPVAERGNQAFGNVAFGSQGDVKAGIGAPPPPLPGR